VEERSSRTPEVSLEDTFLIAVSGLPEEDVRAAVVAEALGHLQQGFDAHYAGDRATDDDVLVGDNSYALAVETIARLDEPRFVAVASRMIRDGAGLIAAGGAVSLRTWIPHLAGLLDIISGEGEERSEARIEEAAEELRKRSG
jgi:methylmalonyl-CoA mutase cobalamin-binding subunit